MKYILLKLKKDKNVRKYNIIEEINTSDVKEHSCSNFLLFNLLSATLLVIRALLFEEEVEVEREGLEDEGDDVLKEAVRGSDRDVRVGALE